MTTGVAGSEMMQSATLAAFDFQHLCACSAPLFLGARENAHLHDLSCVYTPCSSTSCFPLLVCATQTVIACPPHQNPWSHTGDIMTMGEGARHLDGIFVLISDLSWKVLHVEALVRIILPTDQVLVATQTDRSPLDS